LALICRALVVGDGDVHRPDGSDVT
jgi:hypothetical protein